MTDQGPLCPTCQAETQYLGKITKKGHPQDGRHLYQCPTKGCSLTGEGRTAVALEEKYMGGQSGYRTAGRLAGGSPRPRARAQRR